MFTGIIENQGKISSIIHEGTNKHFWISSTFAHELKIDQSIAHNGVCLTVVEIKDNQYKVTAIDETLRRTNLNQLIIEDEVNIERCMPANGRFDGHIVQGHVDDVAVCESIVNKGGSWVMLFKISNKKNRKLIVEKGSICINGISLTVASVHKNKFTVAIIPYTFDHTNLNRLKEGNLVNIELDIIGKYIAKILNNKKAF